MFVTDINENEVECENTICNEILSQNTKKVKKPKFRKHSYVGGLQLQSH